VQAAALAARAVGISTIPIRGDGSKKSALPEWNPYQMRLATEAEINQWYSGHSPLGYAVVGGAVSGDLEVLDFDKHGLLALFVAVATAAGYGEVVARIIRGYHECSPNGDHLLYRCTPTLGSKRLAQTYDRDERGKIKIGEDGHPLLKTKIETRGDGGYCIVAPSGGRVHASGKPYRLLSGGFATIATISVEERLHLYAVARVFNDIPERERPPRPEQVIHTPSNGDRPGDKFNEQVDWADILDPIGWTLDHTDGEEEHWTRPGKSGGTSGTANYQGNNLFYMFTTSTALEAGRSYNKFSLYAHLHHGGDFVKAAAALRALGYGSSPPDPCDADAPTSPNDAGGITDTAPAPATHPLPDPHDVAALWNTLPAEISTLARPDGSRADASDAPLPEAGTLSAAWSALTEVP
jgi:putative DNA primase/helicase